MGVILAPAEPSLDAPVIELARLVEEPAARVERPCGPALVLRTPAGDLHLGVLSPSLTGAFTLLLPFDSELTVRAAAAARFDRLIRGRPMGAPPAPWRLTSQQRRHLACALRALDGHLAGASPREIARVVFGRTVAGRAWVGGDLHSRVKRALRLGRALMDGGYRGLLASPLRGRRVEDRSP